jgi:hypothetical protein
LTKYGLGYILGALKNSSGHPGFEPVGSRQWQQQVMVVPFKIDLNAPKKDFENKVLRF